MDAPSSARTNAGTPDFLSGGGELGALIRAHDWSGTPLGPIEAWPQSLKTATAILLRSPVPIVLLWGGDGIMIYNDAYSGFAGDRHPTLLGAKVREGWPEVADFNDNVMKVGLAGGTLAYKDQELTLYRYGRAEQVWMNLDYSPVLDESGEPAGVIAIVVETTEKVLAERSQAFQFDLAERLRWLADPIKVKAVAAEMLGRQIGVARAGYGEIDAAAEVVSVERDWTDGSVASLAGEARVLDAFGPAVIAELKAGRTLVVEDCYADPRAGQAYAPTWDSIGCRSLVVVPLVKEGRFSAILYLHEPKPRRWTDAEVALAEDVAERTWAAVERARSDMALRASEARLRSVFAIKTVGVMFWGEGFGLTDMNDAFLRMTGFSREEALGKTWQELTPAEFHPASLKAVAEVTTLGETTPYEKQYFRKDGSRWWGLFAARRIGDEVVEFVLDITDRRQAEEHRDLLLAELSHRVKNTLATVQSIAQQTLRGADTPEAYRDALTARVMALSQAHGLLSQSNWEGATLGDVIRAELRPHLGPDSARLALAGEAVQLAPRAALSLGMAFHELATNAAKYGALSVPAGRIAVSWHVRRSDAGDGTLVLDWIESGGPPVAPPTRRGFGSTLIERGLAHDLDGAVALVFDPAGLRCTMEIPLRREIAGEIQTR